MNAPSIIRRFMTGATGVVNTYTITRSARATMSPQGIAIPDPAPVKFTIKASVQPASGRDLQRLPEGRQSLETRIVYTTVELLVGGQNKDTEADQITIEGEQFEVQTSEPWRPDPWSPVGFTRAIVQAMNLQAFGGT